MINEKKETTAKSNRWCYEFPANYDDVYVAMGHRTSVFDEQMTEKEFRAYLRDYLDIIRLPKGTHIWPLKTI